jgi:uncharacterized membrane protein YhiD involved in acid resistance
VLGLFISFIYMITNQSCYSQSFVLTLVMLPIVIALIILLVGSNVARAFSLAGAFSIIRFRSTMGSPKDMAYIFFTMAVGLALGVGMVGYGVLTAIALCLIMLVLSKIDYGRVKNAPKQLRIMLPENLDYDGLFDDIFEEYTESHDIRRVKTADLGSLFEVVYDISLKKQANEKNFIDELRCRNSNLSISISAREEAMS